MMEGAAKVGNGDQYMGLETKQERTMCIGFGGNAGAFRYADPQTWSPDDWNQPPNRRSVKLEQMPNLMAQKFVLECNRSITVNPFDGNL
jgi:hypothetical protein